MLWDGSFGEHLLSEGFGDANYAVLVAAIGECTQLKVLDLGGYDAMKLHSLPDSEWLP